jgi:S1-C subfamily serine protease
VEHTPDLSVLALLSNQMADAVEQAGAAVVLVNGRERLPATGVVFDTDLVLTADHVLERDEDITIETASGTILAARLVGRDPTSDLAVLRVDGLGIAPATQGTARVGQIVLAVGRPASGGAMASLGVVSALSGPLRRRRGVAVEQVIQTDATPYPGFSGGPLIDAQGAVLGILTTGLVRSTPLAIPTAVAWRIAGLLAQQGHMQRGYLGIASQPIHLPVAQRGGLTQERGLLLMRVEEGSPAEQGGLLLGDILVSVNGQTITDTDQLQAVLSTSPVGTALEMGVLRGGAVQQVVVTVGQRA